MDTPYRVRETEQIKELRERIANSREKIMSAGNEPGFATSLYGMHLMSEHVALTVQLAQALRGN